MSQTLRRRRLLPAPFIPRRQSAVQHVAGLVLALEGAGMAASAAVAAVTDGRAVAALLLPAAGCTAVGLVLWRTSRVPARMRTASIFAAVLTSWGVLSLAGTLPFLAADTFPTFLDALFESVSGFTTTGSTVLRPIEVAPLGILFWRGVTQWMGGIGVVVFAVSVLSFLGVGGMGLMEAEAPGPSSERLAPRVRETARRLVKIYIGFTVVVIGGYLAFGMGLYDAVSHAFTTVSTGGFSPYQASFAAFDSAPLEWTAVAAMIFAGGNFALYHQALSGRPVAILRSVEFRAYLALMTGICGIAVASNTMQGGWTHDLVRRTIFSVISLSSSTGYTIEDYDAWSSAVRLVLIFAMALGGMAGSTTGGFKVFRLVAVLAYARRQLFRQLHPRSVDVVRVGGEALDERIVGRVMGFFGLFVAIGAVATFFVALSGLDPLSAVSAVATSIGNVGPGLGAVGPTTDFLNVAPAGRLVLILVMLIGRLEIFPVLLGVVPLLRFFGQRVPRRWTSRVSRWLSG